MSKQIPLPHILHIDEIRSILPDIDVFQSIKQGFVAYSSGEATIPPVGELLFRDPPGDVHIKYGYVGSQPYYVVKIASGFYKNHQYDLPSSQGLNLLFDKSTGVLCAVLLDEGYLTDVRTAVAGALATKSLMPSSARVVGVVGAGIQARMQLEYHEKIMKVEQVFCWNHNEAAARRLAAEMQEKGYSISAAHKPA